MAADPREQLRTPRRQERIFLLDGMDPEREIATEVRTRYTEIYGDAAMSPQQTLDTFWTVLVKSPEHLARGVQHLVNEIVNNQDGSQERNTAGYVLKRFAIDHIPTLLTRLHKEGGKERREALVSSMLLTSALARHTEEDPIPREVSTLLYHDVIGRSVWNLEQKTLLLIETITTRNYANRSQIPQQLDTEIKRHLSTVVHTLVDAIKAKKFDAKTFQLAVVGFGPPNKIGIVEQNATLEEICAAYCTAFLKHFESGSAATANTSMDAMEVIIDAAKEGSEFTKAYLARFLVDRAWTETARIFDGSFMHTGGPINFSPILHRLIQTAHQEYDSESSRERAQKTIRRLLQAFMDSTGPISTNILLRAISTSDEFLAEKPFIAGAYFALLQEKLGFVLEQPLSDEELVDILNGNYIIESKTDEEGEPVLLFAMDSALDDEGKLKDVLPDELGRVIGRMGKRKRQEARPRDETVPRSEEPATVLFVAEGNPIGATSEQPRFVQFIGEPIVLFETREQRIIKALQEELSGQELSEEELREQHAAMWKDIYASPFPKRKQPLHPKGHIARLGPRKMSPLVILRPQPDGGHNGLASDIGGEVVFFEGEPPVPFVLDRQGIPMGPLADLYLEGKISDIQLLQISHRFVTLAAAVTMPDREQQARRAARSYITGKKEIATPEGIIVKERLAKLQEEGRIFLVKTEYEEGDTDETIVNEVEVRKELERGERYHVTIPLPYSGSVEVSGRKGRVIEAPTWAFPVLLPSGQRPSVQAVENAEKFHVALPRIRVYEIDSETGLLVWTQLNTTCRTVVREQVRQEAQEAA